MTSPAFWILRLSILHASKLVEQTCRVMTQAVKSLGY